MLDNSLFDPLRLIHRVFGVQSLDQFKVKTFNHEFSLSGVPKSLSNKLENPPSLTFNILYIIRINTRFVERDV